MAATSVQARRYYFGVASTLGIFLSDILMCLCVSGPWWLPLQCRRGGTILAWLSHWGSFSLIFSCVCVFQGPGGCHFSAGEEVLFWRGFHTRDLSL